MVGTGTTLICVPDVEGDEPFESPIEKFRKTAAGSVLAAGLLGLADALEGRHDDKVAIVTEYSGDPLDDTIVLRLDPDDPRDSIVLLRAPKRPARDD